MTRRLQIIWDAVHGVLDWWKYRKRLKTVAAEELPEELERRCLYILGGTRPWSVALRCPCGCGEEIQLSLLRNDSPRWKLRVDHGNLPTLSPSVWRTKGCRSHFFLRQGSIVWCGASGKVSN